MPSQDRAPAFPFYAKDWLADAKVRSLTYAERGRYIDLLATMWDYSDAGCYLPRKAAERLYGKAFVKMIADNATSPLASEEMDGELHIFSHRLMQEAQKMASRRAEAKRAIEIRWERERERKRNTDVLPE